MPNKKHNEERKIDPKSFYTKTEGEHISPPEKRKLNISNKTKEPKKVIEKVIDRDEPIPKPFDSKEYQRRTNKNLEEKGANIRVYNKNSYNLILSILIGVIIVFGLFFVWSVSNDKFKADFTCPDCNCEQADLTCPDIVLPDFVCNQTLTCPVINNSDIINAISNLNISCINSSY